MTDQGYQASFLGVPVPLPKVKPSGSPSAVLKHTHFSVVMSTARHLANYSAFNFDSTTKKTAGERPFGPDPNYHDIQVNVQSYANNDWDRGHLAALNFVQWGSNEVADVAARQSCYMTNVAPQHVNMHTTRGREWSIVEQSFVLLAQTKALGGKLSGFTGCVFSDSDRVFSGPGPTRFDSVTKIPQFYWYVGFYIDRVTRKLVVKAFKIQNYAIRGANQFDFDPNVSLQVRLADIERITAVRFPAELHTAEMAAVNPSL